MKIHDISLTITNELPVWPGDPRINLERVNKIEEGANSNVSHLKMGVHAGTHVDAPVHFLTGASTVETLPLDVLIGPAKVVELPDDVKVVDAEAIKSTGLKPGAERVLFKTRNSRYWAENNTDFQKDFVGIAEDGARYLVDLGVRLVGIDYLSIAPYKQSTPTHRALLEARIVVVEGLDLSQVNPGSYQLVCLPMKLGGSDGAPARVVLIEE